MKQNICTEGVKVSVFDADKFKRCRISINFIWENGREDATSAALLPYLMERGYAACPDMTELSKKLSALYGAELAVGLSSGGGNRVLTVSVCGLKNEFALNDEQLISEYLQLALGVAFTPTLDANGLFVDEFINIEREKLREMLESEINEKRSYCIRQARRRFFKGTPEGVEAAGYLDEVDSITAKTITNAYNKMIQTAQIEIIAFGADENIICDAVKTALIGVKRCVTEKREITAQPSVKPERFTQAVDAVQGKLCMLFTSGQVIPKEEFTSTRVAVALLGATPTSRLFMNVREKQSLCYYCVASFVYTTGVLCIDSGVEHENAEKTRAAVLAEIEKLKTEKIEEKELSEIKSCLINSLKSMGDSLAGLESWYFGEIIRGSLKTPQQVIDEINEVKIDDIKKALSYFTLSVEYVLTQKGANDGKN